MPYLHLDTPLDITPLDLAEIGTHLSNGHTRHYFPYTWHLESNDPIAELEAQVSELEEDLKSTEAERDNFANKVDDLESDLDTLKDKLEDREKELEEAYQKFNSLST